MNGKMKFNIEVIFHDTGAISIDNIRYGPQLFISRYFGMLKMNKEREKRILKSGKFLKHKIDKVCWFKRDQLIAETSLNKKKGLSKIKQENIKMKIANWIIVVRRLRETTGGTWKMVKDYCERKNYWPLSHRSKFVAFCNDSFVKYWTKR